MNFPTNGYPIIRKRRNRRTDFIRDLTSEVNISSEDLILPIFLTQGKNKKQKIKNSNFYLIIIRIEARTDYKFCR